MTSAPEFPEPTRRTFLSATAATVAAAVPSGLHAGVHAAGSDLLKVGLVGAGGRGTGAAENALTADEATELVAIADVFQDAADRARRQLARSFNGEGKPPRVTVTDDTCIAGFDAFLKVVELSDVVLLASTPHFRPQHMKACVEAGKHVFCEKPVAVDAPGVRSVLESCEIARQKSLNVVSGLCWRYHPAKQAVFEQIHSGAIGPVVAMDCSYMSEGVWEPRRRRDQCGSEMEHQLRNWYYYTWLSGDFNVEQHIHSLDKMLWAMKDEPPVTISGSGGRQVRTDERYGNIYDHFNVVYEWANGVRAYARCRHWPNCETHVNDTIFGTNGRVDVMGHQITGPSGSVVWKYDGPDADMYLAEHQALFRAIRSGQPINNGDYMCKSTLLAIAGRMSAYTGRKLTWDEVVNSKEDLTPPAYEWGDIPVPTVAIPGKTPFI